MIYLIIATFCKCRIFSPASITYYILDYKISDYFRSYWKEINMGIVHRDQQGFLSRNHKVRFKIWGEGMDQELKIGRVLQTASSSGAPCSLSI